MGVATDLSGRLIRFNYTHTVSYPYDYVEMEILSGRIVARPAQVGHYLPIGRIVANTITHGIIVECEVQAALLMRDLPWDKISGTISTTDGVGTIVAKKLSVNTTVPAIEISLNRGGLSTEDEYYDEQRHIFYNPVITQVEHIFDTTTHQVVAISFVTDGNYFEPNASPAP